MVYGITQARACCATLRYRELESESRFDSRQSLNARFVVNVNLFCRLTFRLHAKRKSSYRGNNLR